MARNYRISYLKEAGDYYLLATSDKVTEKTLSDVRELEEQGDMQLFFKR